MATTPTETPRKTVDDCIMRALICIEDVAGYELPDGADSMIQIYENRVWHCGGVRGPEQWTCQSSYEQPRYDSSSARACTNSRKPSLRTPRRLGHKE